ncbi:MAG: DUF523 domain-containing protein [Selenomonas sp.]|uniref:DUF523 domain-containing protein n=1 Tax=Selenomonas sp. TaxID=2053611 RepID=UPI0025FED304|nr:DUF523 domain-containing protein [Selenomonas sp.]MCR5758523.1 DUF523 domain-containing protein [Selenomonas sp.]
MILVSACLLGHKVKFSGGTNTHDLLLKYNERGRFIAVCPECFAMLPCPRPAMEIQNGTGKKVLSGKARAMDENGMDTTKYLLMGADKVLKIAEAYNAKVAILKEGSPSCGVKKIHGGNFDGKKIKGQGVTTALLQKHGITVYSEKDMTVGRLEELIAEDVKRDRI